MISTCLNFSPKLQDREPKSFGAAYCIVGGNTGLIMKLTAPAVNCNTHKILINRYKVLLIRESNEFLHQITLSNIF